VSQDGDCIRDAAWKDDGRVHGPVGEPRRFASAENILRSKQAGRAQKKQQHSELQGSDL
jgi:hypothetical protein